MSFMIKKNIMWALPATSLHYLESMAEMLSEVPPVVMILAIKGTNGELESCKLSIKADEVNMDGTLVMVGACLGAHFSEYMHEIAKEREEDLFEKASEPEDNLFKVADPGDNNEAVIDTVVVEEKKETLPKTEVIKEETKEDVKEEVIPPVEKAKVEKSTKKEFAKTEPVKKEVIKPVVQTEEQAKDLSDKKDKIASKDISAPMKVVGMTEKEAKQGKKTDTPYKKVLRKFLCNFMKF